MSPTRIRYLFFRGTQWPANGFERIGLAKAASWRGPYQRVSEDDAIFTGRQVSVCVVVVVVVVSWWW